MLNDVLREVHAIDILPNKSKKNPLRGYRSETFMTTTTAGKRSGMKRHMSEVMCHTFKVKGHCANKCSAISPLTGATRTKSCSLHKTPSHSDDECMAQQASPESVNPVFALPATISTAAGTCSFTFVASSYVSCTKNGGLQLLVDSDCSSNIIDLAIISNADNHLREYQVLHPPKIVHGAGSREFLATGTAKLTIRVENTAYKQPDANMFVLLVRGLYSNMLSSPAVLVNGVQTTIYSFLALTAKGETFQLRADQNLYLFYAILPNLPSERANVGETSSVML